VQVLKLLEEEMLREAKEFKNNPKHQNGFSRPNLRIMNKWHPSLELD